MKYINIVVEGNSEEAFVKDVMVPHFAPLNIYLSARRIRTGWDRMNSKPAKGGLLKRITIITDNYSAHIDTWY